MHEFNSFITLTYRDEQKSQSLDYTDFQLFMKRLRKHFPKDRIGFFACGEYGETNPQTRCIDGGKYRAHFHAILFNFGFPDRVPVKMLGQSDLYKSEILEKLWRHGQCKIGAVTFESAAYVARYAMKKVNGDLAKQVYTLVTPDGEIIDRTPEMLVMSKRPAIGKNWFKKYGAHAYHNDKVIARGVEMQPPKYYDKLLPKVILQIVTQRRESLSAVNLKDHTDERNNVRNDVVKSALKQLERD